MYKTPTKGQSLLLLLLLGAGIGVIRHIGHNVYGGSAAPEESKSLAPAQTPVGEATIKKDPVPANLREKDAGETAIRAPEAGAGRTSSSGELHPPLSDLLSRKGVPKLIVNERGRFLATNAIPFNPGKPTLHSTSDRELDGIAALLKERPDIHLEILGHTDSYGEEASNVKLTAERAATVLKYLVSRGVEASRLTSRGMGSAVPIAPNNRRSGRQANRRIEFLVTSPK